MALSIGKMRGLSQCSTDRGIFTILALDHRGNLRRLLNPEDPASVSYAAMVDFKREVVANLSPHASAVLVDPEISAASVVAQRALPGRTGLLLALEATGYQGGPTKRASQVLPGWGVDKIRRMGASGVKLLVYFHPDSEIAGQQEALITQVAEDCRKYDLPLFLEPLSYSLDPERKKLPPDELRQVVVETARILTKLGIDILKAEFPVDTGEQPDEAVWFEACQELTLASQVPWALLSAGVDFETYLHQVVVACRAGASGVLAGRAVWKEAAELQGNDRGYFLRTQAAERMRRLAGLCDALGKPWTEGYSLFEPLPEDWYAQYPGLE